jgi:hypothetical protein
LVDLAFPVPRGGKAARVAALAGIEAVGLSIRRPIDVGDRIDESEIVEDSVGLERIAG